MAKLIMVFDDAQDILSLYEQILTGAGYRVNLQLHSEGDVEIDLVKQIRPELIIVDLLYPQRYTGWTLIQKVRTDPQTAATPIILCTAKSGLVQQLAPQLNEKKVQVVYKPFEVDKFVEIVTSLLASGQSE